MIELIIAGAVGGLAKSLLEKNGRVTLPRVEDAPDGTKYVYFGFLVNVVLGAIAGVLAPGGVLASLTAAMAVTYTGESVVEKVQ